MARTEIKPSTPGSMSARDAARLGELEPLRRIRGRNFTKADVRQLARLVGLPNWDRAASACLASRFPYGTEITRENLARVERLEEMLSDLGFKQARARYHGDIIRIEVGLESISRAASDAVRDKIVQAARREGFRFVVLDLQGSRTGSLNP